MRTDNEIANYLNDLKNQNHLNVREIAARSNGVLTASYVSRYLSKGDTSSLTLKRLQAFANVFNVSVSDILNLNAPNDEYTEISVPVISDVYNYGFKNSSTDFINKNSNGQTVPYATKNPNVNSSNLFAVIEHNKTYICDSHLFFGHDSSKAIAQRYLGLKLKVAFTPAAVSKNHSAAITDSMMIGDMNFISEETQVITSANIAHGISVLDNGATNSGETRGIYNNLFVWGVVVQETINLR